jgi:hypothetical protein
MDSLACNLSLRYLNELAAPIESRMTNFLTSALADRLGRGGFFRSTTRRRPSRSVAGGRRFESLEAKNLLASVPFGALADDTGIYMVGDVNVNVVFLESDGSLDTSTENWSPAHKEQVKQNIVDGLAWWETAYDATGYTADLNFNVDFTYADAPVATRYEPISRISNDYTLWVDEFLTTVGHQSSEGLAEDIRDFNHAGRLENQTHWSFTIFVVNSEQDEALNGEGRFASGGSHSRAFAFAGGLFFVMPSTRPASTVAHETGHMFYAYDEYTGGGASYYAHRGYLNVQNTNGGASNPNPLSRQISIMDSHELAYPYHAISDSARETIGWRDSDGNGIIDILDVPHTLTGVGHYDSASETYHFAGQSSVNTLPNRNTWDLSLQSDVTLNELQRVEYRLDGGPWTTIASLGGPSAELILEIEGVASTTNAIEIRTIDDYTGVTSPVFTASLDQPTATNLPGVNGFVWLDENSNGVWDAGESALEGWSVDVLDSQGTPLPPPVTIEADAFDHNTVINHAHPQATLTAVGFGVWENTVRSRDRDGGASGERVFKHFIGSGWSSSWTYGNGIPQYQRQLRIDFAAPVTTVSIDAIANSDNDYGQLEIYDALDNLLARYTTAELSADQIETMTLSVDSPRIAYALASGHANTGVDLDNLQFNAAGTVTTAVAGNYAAAYLQPGSYQVSARSKAGYAFTTAAVQSTTLAAGQAVASMNFGVVRTAPPWQNQTNPLDVDISGTITLNDALLIVSELRRHGQHPLEGEPSNEHVPRIDVNGDGLLTLSDALDIINHLRRGIQSGEGEAALAQAAAVASSPLLSEGEGEEATFRLEVTNLSGTPISTIEAGQQFFLNVYVHDLRPATTPDRGIQVAFLDIIHDIGPVAPVATSGNFPIDITFSPEFQHTPDVFGVSPGLINDVGALQTNPGAAEPLGANEVLLFKVRFNALAGGEVLFQGNDADEPGNDVRFYDPPDPAIDPTLLTYGMVELTVTQPLQARDDSMSVNPNTTANPLPVLTNDLSTGSFSVTSVGSTASGGTVTIPAGGGQVRYTPPTGFVGFDAFNYTISSGSASSTARVQVKVGTPAAPYRNPINPLDVNASGGITLNDALLIVSDLRVNGVHTVVLPPTAASSPPPFLDVTGDNTITLNDALQVIAHLRNQQSSGEEGEASDPREVLLPAAEADAPPLSVDHAMAQWEAPAGHDPAMLALLASLADDKRLGG